MADQKKPYLVNSGRIPKGRSKKHCIPEVFSF